MKKICVVTGSRAEFGLLHGVMEEIRSHDNLALQVVVTGMHLSPEFGYTVSEVEKHYVVDRRVETLLSSDSAVGLAKSMGLGMIGFADVWQDLRPDMIILLGDRFEILPAATAALVALIPVAHLHGGEKTEAAFDEAIRHSLTKISSLHFVATPEYRKRVLQLGEDPSRVHVVGGLGVDAISRMDLLQRSELEKALGLQLGTKNLVVTFHPETLGQGDPMSQMQELLDALDVFPDISLIFTFPNADNQGRALISLVESYVQGRENARAYHSLGQRLYLSCLKFVDGVVGNSSSGLLEAPSFGIGTINIGARQKGRLKASSVIDCEPRKDSISAALRHLYSAGFRQIVRGARNPYGEPGASKRIVDTIASTKITGLTRKIFCDVSFNVSGCGE
jgi:GDP/UDP-N,N'-diacetylbacillosamine 2-epimerase (hydrolysing)